MVEQAATPTTLGRYELLVPIAQGGMAAVWAARLRGTRGFQKTVAVKCMLPALSEDPQFEEMFLAEAELASRIRHPNVCEILDLGEQEGTLYIVMEWVDGEPLSTIQKAARATGGVPMAIATRIVLNAAAGLHAAHELKTDTGDLVGLVHRDVSPQNILVTYDGVVKIVDFGVAKATAEADGGFTKAGQIKGKVPFMSPEQALGKPIDRRTDVFALGIVLFQLLTGKHPFRGENDMATLHKICDPVPVPPLHLLLPDCPPSLVDAVAQSLEKDASRRFSSMMDFARSLERALAAMTTAGADQDLGAFVRASVGDRGEKRRAAIKEALRTVDERAKMGATTGQFAAMPPMSIRTATTMPGVEAPLSGRISVTGVSGVGPLSGSGAWGPGSGATGSVSAVPAINVVEAKSSSGGLKIALVVGLLLGALGGAGLFVLRGRAKADVPPSTAALPTSPPVATAQTPANVVASVASVAPAPSASVAPAVSASVEAPAASASAVAKPLPMRGTGPMPPVKAYTGGPKLSNPGF
jgi:serine/threonine-protein kinase